MSCILDLSDCFLMVSLNLFLCPLISCNKLGRRFSGLIGFRLNAFSKKTLKVMCVLHAASNQEVCVCQVVSLLGILRLTTWLWRWWSEVSLTLSFFSKWNNGGIMVSKVLFKDERCCPSLAFFEGKIYLKVLQGNFWAYKYIMTLLDVING